MLLGSLARREDARGDGVGADQLTHRSIEPFDVEKVVLFAFSQQNILPDVVKDAV